MPSRVPLHDARELDSLDKLSSRGGDLEIMLLSLLVCILW